MRANVDMSVESARIGGSSPIGRSNSGALLLHHQSDALTGHTTEHVCGGHRDRRRGPLCVAGRPTRWCCSDDSARSALHYSAFGCHSRASRCASATCSGVRRSAAMSRFFPAESFPSTRREIEPLVGLDVVLRRAVAVAIHGTEAALGVGLTLLGCPAKPLQRRGIVLRHALANTVHKAKVRLGGGISPAQRLCDTTRRPGHGPAARLCRCCT